MSCDARATVQRARTQALVAVSVVLFGVVSAACSDEQDTGAASTASTSAVTEPAAAPAETTSIPPATSDAVPITADPDVSATTGRPMAVEWIGDGRRTGSVEVPLDREDPAVGTTTVRFRRAAALDPERRIGVLFVNPGGPGVDAFELIGRAPRIFSTEIRQRFDIVAVAPRGTDPNNAPVSCLDFEDRLEFESSVDWSPDAAGELEALEAHLDSAVQQCADDNPGLLEHVSTMDTVDDMASVVDALGEDEVSYLGFSYGTALGAAFATAHPELVRAAVLDAAYHPAFEPAATARAAAIVQEARLASLYDECDADPRCPVEGDARSAFERVARAADAGTLQGDPDLPPINEQALRWTIFFHRDVYAGAPDVALYRAIADADAGDADALQRRYRDAIRSQSLPAIFPIRCIDWPYRDEDPLPVDFAETLAEETPLRSALFPAPPADLRSSSGGICGRWPAGPEPLPSPLSAEGAGPVLVLGSTGDVATPIGSAELLRDELVDASLVYVDSDVHGSYNASGSPEHRCATELVDEFLIELELPADGTVCATEPDDS